MGIGKNTTACDQSTADITSVINKYMDEKKERKTRKQLGKATSRTYYMDVDDKVDIHEGEGLVQLCQKKTIDLFLQEQGIHKGKQTTLENRYKKIISMSSHKQMVLSCTNCINTVNLSSF